MRNNLISSVFKYFPKILEEKIDLNLEVEGSKEFHSLKQLIYNSNHFKEKSIIFQIGEIAQQKRLSFLVCDRKSAVYKRSLGVRLGLFEESNIGFNYYTDLVLALSLLAPVYFLEVVTTKTQQGIILEERILPEFEIPEKYDFLKELLKSKEYSKIPQSDFEKVIPQVSHLEIEVNKFTIFNAFFANTIGDLMY